MGIKKFVYVASLWYLKIWSYTAWAPAWTRFLVGIFSSTPPSAFSPSAVPETSNFYLWLVDLHFWQKMSLICSWFVLSKTLCEMFGAIASFKSFCRFKLDTLTYQLGYQPHLQPHFRRKFRKIGTQSMFLKIYQ